jgi:uncharacterized protein (DUF1778 family)
MLMLMTKRGTVTIRARAETRDALNELAAATGQSVPELLDELAVRERDRRLLHDGLERLAALDADTARKLEQEFRAWDDADLLDGPLPEWAA